MSYSEKQEEAIQNDIEDLQTLKQQIQKVKDMKFENQSLKQKKDAHHRSESLKKDVNDKISDGKIQKEHKFKVNAQSKEQHFLNSSAFLSPNCKNSYPTYNQNSNVLMFSPHKSINPMLGRLHFEKEKTFSQIVHHQTKRNVINGFVEELTFELEKNQETLKRQRKIHEETRQSLQKCLEEMSEFRNKHKKIESQYNSLMRQNKLLKEQCEGQCEKRIMAEEKVHGQAALLQRYEQIFMKSCYSYEQQFERMELIYESIEKTLEI